MSRVEVYCPECGGFRPVVREPIMPATCIDLEGYRLEEMRCSACGLLVVTLRTVRDLAVVEGFRRGERSRA